MKPRLVVKKRSNRRGVGLRDQSMETNELRASRKQKRINYSVATVVDIVPEAPQENLATEVGGEHNRTYEYQPMMSKLDKKKAQMIKRNMSVHTKLNRRLREIEAKKRISAGVSPELPKKQLGEHERGETTYNNQYSAYINSSTPMMPGFITGKHMINDMHPEF